MNDITYNNRPVRILVTDDGNESRTRVWVCYLDEDDADALTWIDQLSFA